MLELPVLFGDSKLPAQQGLRCGCSQADPSIWFYAVHFGIKPRATGVYFGGVWLVMNTALAARLPLEMFHNIGKVHCVAIDSNALKRFVQDSASWAHKWFAREVLIVARLFAHQ